MKYSKTFYNVVKDGTLYTSENESFSGANEAISFDRVRKNIVVADPVYNFMLERLASLKECLEVGAIVEIALEWELTQKGAINVKVLKTSVTGGKHHE